MCGSKFNTRARTSPSSRPMTSSLSVDIAWVVHVQKTSACIRVDVPTGKMTCRGGGGVLKGRVYIVQSRITDFCELHTLSHLNAGQAHACFVLEFTKGLLTDLSAASV